MYEASARDYSKLEVKVEEVIFPGEINKLLAMWEKL